MKDQTQIASHASQSLLSFSKRCSLLMAFCPIYISKYISPSVLASVNILHIKSQHVLWHSASLAIWLEHTRYDPEIQWVLS